MDAREAAVERLLPHRGGMLWIDRVLHCDAGPGRSGRLFLLAHHLVVDGVTWRVPTGSSRHPAGAPARAVTCGPGWAASGADAPRRRSAEPAR